MRRQIDGRRKAPDAPGGKDGPSQQNRGQEEAGEGTRQGRNFGLTQFLGDLLCAPERLSLSGGVDLRQLPPLEVIRHSGRGGAMALSLNTTVNDIRFENPFLLASRPPGTIAKVIAKSYDLASAGGVCKTIRLDATKLSNTA